MNGPKMVVGLVHRVYARLVANGRDRISLLPQDQGRVK